MNVYSKFCPNVFLAKCEEKYEKGEVIEVTTKYGKENECIVFNFDIRKRRILLLFDSTCRRFQRPGMGEAKSGKTQNVGGFGRTKE